MKLIFLGSGSAFSLGNENFHSNVLITCNENSLLIDCGTDIPFSLNKSESKVKAINGIYISHLHGDHAGGLEWLAQYRNLLGYHKVDLHISSEIYDDLWEKLLKGGLAKRDKEKLEDFFNVNIILNSGSFNWEGINFQLVQTVHYYHLRAIKPSYGLFFTINGIKVFFTGDTLFTPNHLDFFYQNADIIFHDCCFLKQGKSVHSSYNELLSLDDKIKSKMWLYHYNNTYGFNAHDGGFRGIVKCGQIFDFSNLNSF